MKLASIQIVLGVLIIGALISFIGWIEWDYGSFTTTWNDVEVEMHPLTGWLMRLISWKVFSFILGIAVLGCGIAQFITVRRRGMA